MVRRAQVNPTARFSLPDPDVLKHENARKHRHLHFRNPSVVWWGQFAEMDKFLVLVKTRQCKVKGASVCLETGREQAAPQAHGTNFFFILVEVIQSHAFSHIFTWFHTFSHIFTWFHTFSHGFTV